MQHRYAVHAINRFLEHYALNTRADDPTAGWFAPLRDAALAAESEVVPVCDDAEEAEALASVALNLLDLIATPSGTLSSGVNTSRRKARDRTRRLLSELHDVVSDRERVRAEFKHAVSGSLLGEVLDALGRQGGTRQQALDEIRRLRADSLECPAGANLLLSPPLRTRECAERNPIFGDRWRVAPGRWIDLDGHHDPETNHVVSSIEGGWWDLTVSSYVFEGNFAAQVKAPAKQAPEAPARTDFDAEEAFTGDAPFAGPVALADLPIGSITVLPDGTYATVRQPYGWDLATDSLGTPFHVSPGWGGHEPAGEVVHVGNGEVPEEWTRSYKGVAALVRAWADRREAERALVPTAEIVAPAVPVGLALVRQELARMDDEPAPEPGQWIHDEIPPVDPDDDCPF